MNPIISSAFDAAVSRRGFMSGSAALMLTAGAGLATLTGCSRQTAADYRYLTDDDVALLTALAPVILGPAYPGTLAEQADKRLLASLDRTIHNLNGFARKELLQLLQMLASAPLRLALGAPFSGWQQASAEDVEDFLQNWRNSSVAVKRTGYSVLCKLFSLVWYAQPENYALAGYPGPPQTDEPQSIAVSGDNQ